MEGEANVKANVPVFYYFDPFCDDDIFITTQQTKKQRIKISYQRRTMKKNEEKQRRRMETKWNGVGFGIFDAIPMLLEIGLWNLHTIPIVI